MSSAERLRLINEMAWHANAGEVWLFLFLMMAVVAIGIWTSED